jgi:hypothetical protein
VDPRAGLALGGVAALGTGLLALAARARPRHPAGRPLTA